MEGSKFAKLCRDSQLLSKSFTATDVDLFFAKVGGIHISQCKGAFLLHENMYEKPCEMICKP
jgi:hypothetical protein